MKTHILCSLFIGLNLLTFTTQGQSDYPLKNSIEKIISDLKYEKTSVGNHRIISREEIVMLYEDNTFSSLWWGRSRLNVQVDEAMSLLNTAYDEGLDPSDYHYEELVDLMKVIKQERPRKVSQQTKIAFEFLLTDGLLTYAAHLYGGKVHPDSFDSDWYADGKELEINYYGYLLNAISSNSLIQGSDKLESKNEGYVKLKQALQYYRQLSHSYTGMEMYDPPLIIDNETLLNDRWIRKRLVENGDLKQAYINHSDSTIAAILSFKKRHGLEENDDLDAVVIQELKIALDDRINTILINLERWRWLPTNLESDYIVVNIANFDLRVIANGTVKMKTRVIVGKTNRQTPVLSSNISGVIINPTWTVPPTILKEDILPLGNGVPGYLDKNRIQVLDYQGQIVHPDSIAWQTLTPERFPYVLRQKPSAGNALGTIKFIMPGKMLIYLHDTPAKALFNQRERAFSSGCIRVQKPYALAQLLFKLDQNMDGDALYKLRDKQETESVVLRKPWKTHILYWTSWVDADGIVHFRKDIYNRDKQLIEVLQTP